MSVREWASGRDLGVSINLAYHESPTVGYYKREVAIMRTRLQEALAREETLLRQLNEMAQVKVASTELSACRQNAKKQISRLTSRQRQIMDMVLAGCRNKIIAADLHISQRTVESHRAAIMHKTGLKSLPALARLALAAA
jgi:two-component system, chemotaxis family, CheB/CheR fusion protein